MQLYREHTLTLRQVDGDSAMDVEIASITQLTNSVQLAEPPPNSLSPQLENDSDAGMDLDGDNNDPSRNVLLSGGILKKKNNVNWDQDEIGTHNAGIVGDSDAGRCSLDSEHEALATGGDGAAALASRRIPHSPTSLASDSRGVLLHAMFANMESHEDDDDSEWLDGASVRADTQSVFAGDSEEDDDGEMREEEDEILSGDEAVVLQGVPDVVKV
jgi:hypothetical protein